MEGKTNPIEDVGIRLVHGLHDSLQDVTLPNLSQLPGNLNLQNINLAPLPMKARARLSKGWSSGWEAVEQLREDWGKRVSAGSLGEQDAFAAAAGSSSAPVQEGASPSILPPASPALSQPSPRVGQSFLAGVDVAKTGAATLATGIGSFFGAQARKTSFFGTNGAAAGTAGVASGPLPTRAGLDAAASSVSDSNSLVAPSAQSTLSTSPGGTSSFLRPLSTAAAATVQASPPSRSSSPVPRSVAASASAPSSPSPPPATFADKPSRPPAPLGVSGFFGGLRRTLSPGPAEPASAPSTPGTVSTTAESGFGTPPLSSFLGVGGWGASAATSRRPTPERNPSLTTTTTTTVATTAATAPLVRARDIMGDLDGRGESSDEEDGEQDRAEADRERELTRRKLEGLSTS